MANKAMWDWMDKAEGKKEGSSFSGMNKERERQGYKKLSEKKKHIASRMKDKGKESLNIPRGEKNEGNKMEEGRNEHNRA